MKMFNKAVIIGTGLIGGSMGIALKKKGIVSHISGLSRNKNNAKLAKKIGAIDKIAGSLDVVASADLVILATPPDTIIDIALKIKNMLKKDCVVIDVGSSKEKIVNKLSPVIPNFIGCHPLAGSEKRGISSVGGDIFKGSTCIITPVSLTNSKALSKVKALWRKLGVKIVISSPDKHDQALSHTSHLPHAIAFSLIDAIPNEFLALSSTSLRDLSRISSSDPDLWSQIFLTNRANLLGAINSFQIKLTCLKRALENKDSKRLIKILKTANKKREILG